MENATLPIDREVLSRIAQDKTCIIEIGTFTGGTAEIIAAHMPEDCRLFTIDSYATAPKAHHVQYIGAEAMLIAARRLEKFGPRVTRIIGDSIAVSSAFADGAADLVFIDGAHDYESVKADILAWTPKLKPDGMLSGHDYNPVERMIRDDYAERMSTVDRCPRTNIHFGVAKALRELLTKWECYNDGHGRDGSVWHTTLDNVKFLGVEE